MAAEAENLSGITRATTNDEDLKYGFQRPEMHQSALKGTIDAYDRHVILCYKGPEAWPSRVENSEEDTLPKVLASAVKARKNDLAYKGVKRI